MSQFSCFLDRCRAGSQFCKMQSEMYPMCIPSDYYCYNIINNIYIDNRLSYCLGEYHIVIECILFICCVGLILKKQKQQIYQPFSYIARLIRLNNTNTDPPDIQVPTMQRLMGGDENETETTTNDMMTGNGDGVSMSNWSFGQHNQIQSAATYTSKLCISGSRIDA